MFITFPPHIINVVGTTLSLFIDIASAPAFFNSFTMSNISLSCTRKSLESNKLVASTSLSFTVIVTPGPLTSDNPKILFPTFICSCASDNSELFSVAFCISSSNSLSIFSISFILLSYLSLYFNTSALKLFSV